MARQSPRQSYWAALWDAASPGWQARPALAKTMYSHCAALVDLHTDAGTPHVVDAEEWDKLAGEQRQAPLMCRVMCRAVLLVPYVLGARRVLVVVPSAEKAEAARAMFQGTAGGVPVDFHGAPLIEHGLLRPEPGPRMASLPTVMVSADPVCDAAALLRNDMTVLCVPPARLELVWRLKVVSEFDVIMLYPCGAYPWYSRDMLHLQTAGRWLVLV